MKKSIVLALLCVSLPLFAQETPPQEDAKLIQYRSAIKALGGTLLGEMKTALAEGGGLKAIDICHDKAADIAAKISKEQGFEVGRTSLKIRSDKNAPDAWEKEQLQKFAERKHAGEDPTKIETGVVVVDGKSRYMKAIPLQDTCLACHGENVPAELSAKIKELYPNDQATGFKIGDIRGAFTITETGKSLQ